MKNIGEERILAKAVHCNKLKKLRILFESEMFIVAE